MSRVSWPFIGEVAPIWFRASLEEMAEVWEVYQQRQRDWFGARTLRPSSFPDLGEALDQVTFVPGTSLLVATRTPWTAVYHYPGEGSTFSTELAEYIPCVYATVELGTGDVRGGGEDRVLRYHRVPRDRGTCQPV